MSDLYAFDLVDGLASGDCPLCYAVARHMYRWLDSFWREGRQEPHARERFYAGGGFCRRHAWLPEGIAETYAAGIADLYRQLARRDGAALAEASASGGKRQRPVRRLRRAAACAACSEEGDATRRKASFFLELLAGTDGRSRYERGRDVCFAHLLVLLEAGGEDRRLVDYLLADWRRRLGELDRRLEHFDRTRDHRYAAERTQDDVRACTDIIRHYVGSAARAAGA